MRRDPAPSIVAVTIIALALTAVLVPIVLGVRASNSHVKQETAQCEARGGDPVRLHGPVILCFEQGILL